MKLESRQEVALRLVAEAEILVEWQEELVTTLENRASCTDQARELLQQFETALAHFRSTLALLACR